MNQALKILVVDDNEQDRKIIKRILRQAGHAEPLEARSAQEAANLAGSHSIDAAIVDTVLPDAEGFEICLNIRMLHPDAKIIMITGHIDALDAGRARKAGADDYVVKTVDGNPLIEALAEHLPGGRDDG
ncbi:MAG: response regulator [Candidatus Omnitrophica bacterium]|jgi:DNA-binding response OmpR family regulator|nr:response regulator [Candidatus Omnitrophota bacterium]